MDQYPSQYPSQQRVTGWVGWIAFAAAFMIISGAFGLIQGFVALFQDDFYAISDSEIVEIDVSAWGWIHIIFGALLVLVGGALLSGKLWARLMAIILVCLHMVAQFAFLEWYPVWSVIVIAIDVLVLWALIVHGEEAAA